MRVQSGTVAFWRELFGGHDKFVYFLGSFVESGHKYFCFFTLSSRTKWLHSAPHRVEMIEIKIGNIDYLQTRTWIQCFHKLELISEEEFRVLEQRGFVMYRGDLPEYLPAVAEVLNRSELLGQRDIDRAFSCIDC